MENNITLEEFKLLLPSKQKIYYEKIKEEKSTHYKLMEDRCTRDVQINILLWEQELTYLRKIYDNDDNKVLRIIKYLNFILQCYREQERQKIRVDVDKVNKNLEYFEELKADRVEALKKAMPKVSIVSVKNKPKVLFKKDGSMSSAYIKWLEFLKSCKLPEETEEPVDYIKGYEEPNPNSVKQKKEWLLSLGWKPETFVYNRDKDTGAVDKVEQIMTPDKNLCPSVLKLSDKEPAILELEGVSVLTHRIGILKGLLKNKGENDFVVQGLYQLANSLRWQHSVIVNFPGVTGRGDISDGKWIRECLIAGEGYKFVQSDLSGIESRTSDHYTYHLNRELIEETSKPYFDPHTKISVVSNLMTKDEEVWFKWKKVNSERYDEGLEPLPPETFGYISEDFEFIRNLDDSASKKLMNKLKAARSKGKTTNYASLYLVGAATLGRNLGIPKKEAQDLIDAYWKIHWAVKKASDEFEIKTIDGQMWVLCPISGFWHPLRYEKDKFSLVNQSSAVYCFNIWLYNITQQGVWPILQTHDDLLLRSVEKESDQYILIIKKAMEKTNRQLGLNIPLDCDTQIGDNFAQTH